MSRQDRFDQLAAERLAKVLERTTPSTEPLEAQPTTGEKWAAVRDEWITAERDKLTANHEPGFNAFMAARGTPRPGAE